MLTEHNQSLSSIYVPLRLTYGLVPFVAGLDKFFNLLTDWTAYLPPIAVESLPVSPAVFMMVVGVIEMTAGIAVLTWFTRLGAWVVCVWLFLIALTLIMGGRYDIAVRDIVMAIGAYTLGQVAALRGDHWMPTVVAASGVHKHATRT